MTRIGNQGPDDAAEKVVLRTAAQAGKNHARDAPEGQVVGSAGERAGIEDVQREIAPRVGQHREAVAITGAHQLTKAGIGLGAREGQGTLVGKRARAPGREVRRGGDAPPTRPADCGWAARPAAPLRRGRRQ